MSTERESAACADMSTCESRRNRREAPGEREGGALAKKS